MIRLVTIQLGLFLLPFALYALWLAARRRASPLAAMREAGPLAGLAIAGLVLVILSLIGLAAFDGGAAGGVYVPDRFENGRLVPGRIE